MVAAPIDLNALAPVPALPARSASATPEGLRACRGTDDEGRVFHGELEQAWNREKDASHAPEAAVKDPSAKPPSEPPTNDAPAAEGGLPAAEGEDPPEATPPAAVWLEALLAEGEPASLPPAPPATGTTEARAAEQAVFPAPSRPAAVDPAGSKAAAAPPPGEPVCFECPGPREAVAPPSEKPAAAEEPAAGTCAESVTDAPKRPVTHRDLFTPPEGFPEAPRRAPAAARAELGSSTATANAHEEAGGEPIPAAESFSARAPHGKPSAVSSAALSPKADVAQEAAAQERMPAPRLQPARPEGPADRAAAEAATAVREAPVERASHPAQPQEAALSEGPAPVEEPSAAPGSGPREPRAETAPGHRAQASSAAEREVPGMPARSQLFDPIVQRATLLARGGREEIRIDLKPDFLGPVRMQIATANQAVSVRILAEMPLVRDWIEAGLQQLKSDLEQQGLRVERLEVAIAPDGRQGSDRRQGFRERASSAPPAAPGKGLEIAQAAGADRGRHPGPWAAASRRVQLDLFA